MAKNKYDAIMENLQQLNEDSFDITTADGLDALKNFELEPEKEVLNITDPESESQEEIEENPENFYLNKLIAVCDICQNPSFMTEEDINEPFTCPYCYSEGTGYSIVGKVVAKDSCEDCSDKKEEDVNVNVDVKPQPDEKVDLDLEEPFEESKCKSKKEEIKESTESRLSKFINDYNNLAKEDSLVIPKDLVSKFNKILTSQLKYVDDYVNPPYREYIIVKLSDKKLNDKKEEIKESAELDINMDDKANVNIKTDEAGDVKIDVNTQDTSEPGLAPIEFEDDGSVAGQEIAELDDDEAVEFNQAVEDSEDNFEFEDVQMSRLVSDFLKEHFEDVVSYKVTKASKCNKDLKVEGIVKFKSGNRSSINFVFEGLDTKAKKYNLIGSCSAFGRNKAFKLSGNINEGVIKPSALSYNFQQKINEQLVRIYGKTEIKG